MRQNRTRIASISISSRIKFQGGSNASHITKTYRIMTDRKFDHLVDTVEYFSWMKYDRGANATLSDEQREQLTEVRDKLQGYSDSGEYVADLWLECVNEMLN